jgi:glutathione S-transferase
VSSISTQIYVRPDLEGLRIRLTVAAKGLSELIEIFDPAPFDLVDINPKQIFPLLADRDLAIYGPAIDEYLEERFPCPTLLPYDPQFRAGVRVLSDEARSYYDKVDSDPDAVLRYMHDVETSYDPSDYWFVCGQMTRVDLAILPLLNALHVRRLWNPDTSRLRLYYTTKARKYCLDEPTAIRSRPQPIYHEEFADAFG